MSSNDSPSSPAVNTSIEKSHCYFPLDKLDEILPRLYLSSSDPAISKEILDSEHITHIVNVTTNVANKFEPEITYKKVVINDDARENLSIHFESTYEFIEKALSEKNSNRVLVHCNAGVSRSATIVMAYLMQKRIFTTYADAYKHVQFKRPIVYPNPGFVKQLLDLEVKLKN